ncbi:histidine phosphatase family protein [Psychrobacter vallis]|uniref:histidine phosphatase family protein n=1 Tax=Psychrobacter vallis TaxID=248451 RepID=UPI00191A47FF|nr:histidine phosphatase family protein [Psychrobacter vallis]
MILYIWRHPKPILAKGKCIGQTDIAVDKRKLKRLANKIERFARLHQLPKVIWVSPLQRSLLVGQILAQRGFQYKIASELAEINFGVWDGHTWEQIAKTEIDDWCRNFAYFAPNDGESLQQLFERAASWLRDRVIESDFESNSQPILVVGHAGWINAAKMIAAKKSVPKIASEWPQSVNYLTHHRLDF